MQRVLTHYASLLDYPLEDFYNDIQSLQICISESNNNQSILSDLELFRDSIDKLSLAELQELYTTTFDLSPVCSLHVGFHLFGESYKRGTLMAKLREDFQKFGLQEGTEIPDHLPNILKFCAVVSGKDQHLELYEESLSLLVCPSVENMVASFDDTTNPYKHLIGSLSTWLTEQCGSSVH